MKKKFLIICYIINLLMIPIVLLYPVILLNIKRISAFSSLTDDYFMNIRLLLTIPVFILWIYCLIIWSKKDKVIYRFLLLLVLNGLYTPFYYYRILKNKWIS
jgi:cytochrome c biogenesis factor